mmetsp:Transcript_6216/g.7665  ORF Transcript_6216/g.7665 Transcript_6216/m.7665 type:complete len:584 (+) Transcript_6216:2329-4080(+)
MTKEKMVNYTTVKLKSPTAEKRDNFPAVLTIAGSDSSGGAGIEADLKTFSAHQVYGLTCITALTGQNTQSVKSFEPTQEYLLKDILKLNFDDFLEGYEKPEDAPLKAIKTGMLTKTTINVLKHHLDYLRERNIKIIVDPVMISTSGSQLFDADGMKDCIHTLIKQAYLVTPNFLEAKSLLEIATGKKLDIAIQGLEEYIILVKQLQKVLGCENILVKGGHIPWNRIQNRPYEGNFNEDSDQVCIIDILYESKTDSVKVYESEFLKTKDTHGTGCTLLSSIAANIAKGYSLQQALLLSINYVQKSMVSLKKKLGHGNGPLNHTVIPEKKISAVYKKDEMDISHYLLDSYDSFLDYLKTHPKVNYNWKRYINHPFVSQLAQNKLEFKKFLYYLKQDYYYLINYAQIHGLAASVSNDYNQIHTQSVIMDEIVKEIERHREKLMKNYNIHYDRDFESDTELSPGKACEAYCSYLLEIGKKEDFLGIRVALAPCLHGYAEAGDFGLKIRQDHGKSLGVLESEDHAEVYDSWLADYTSDWYREAYERGKSSLQSLLEHYPLSQGRLDELVDIFNKVTLLEIDFWDEVLP